jgi:hypothetical protein
MKIRNAWRLLVAAAMWALLVLGCGDDAPQGNLHLGEVAADFAIRDVNPASPRYDEPVSPRDYLGRVSAWYFGHAT